MKVAGLVILPVILFTMTGCGSSSQLVRKEAVSSRNDVFTQASPNLEVPPGYALLRISLSFKTALVQSGRLSQVIDIDGQVLQMAGVGKEEDLDSASLRDSEAGRGLRYKFDANLLVKAGTHRLNIIVPEKEVALTREIVLTSSTKNFFRIEPQYRFRPALRGIPYTGTSYKEGILRLNPELNGSSL